MNIKNHGKEMFDYNSGALLEDKDSIECFGGGGKGSYSPPPAVNPTPPVEEASVAIDETDKKNKLVTGKNELKVPLAETADTGLKI